MQAQDWKDMYEERAAIMEFDGGMSRERAEKAARAWVTREWGNYHGAK